MKPELTSKILKEKLLYVPPSKPWNINYIVGGLLILGFIYLCFKIKTNLKQKEIILPNRITIDSEVITEIKQPENLRLQRPGTYMHDRLIIANNYSSLEN